MSRPVIAVVIPIFNEETYLPVGWARLTGELADLEATVRFILVENGSTDSTGEMADRLTCEYAEVTVLHLPFPDYGEALAAGLASAGTADWIVTFDIDYFSGDFARQATSLDADVVIGSKRLPDSSDQRSLLRRTGSAVFTKILRAGFGVSVTDTHGMKAFRSASIRPLIAKTVSRSDLFDTELVVRAAHGGLTIVELSVNVQEQRPARSAFLSRVPRTLVGLAQLRRILADERKTTSR